MPAFLLGEYWGEMPGNNPIYPVEVIIAESIERVTNWLGAEIGTHEDDDVIWISSERILVMWDGKKYPYKEEPEDVEEFQGLIIKQESQETGEIFLEHIAPSPVKSVDGVDWVGISICEVSVLKTL